MHYISGLEVGERPAHGIAHPHNEVLFNGRNKEFVIRSHSAGGTSLLANEVGYCCAPTYLAPFLKATVVKGQFPLVEVNVAHHL